jgi:uncharacterized protein YcbX
MAELPSGAPGWEKSPLRVAELWRFPVKSLAGERLERAEVDSYGIVGDRRWALADTATGAILTARRVPQLLFAQGCWTAGGGACVLVDGKKLADEEDLSAWLGRSVALVSTSDTKARTYEAPIDWEQEETGAWQSWEGARATFHDSARTQLSIMSRASMRDWDVRRFRSNVVLEAGDDKALVDHRVRIGGVVADVVKRIDRCVMVTRAQPGIEPALDVLRAILGEEEGNLGVGASVVEAGILAVDDLVETLGLGLPTT